MTRIQLYRKVLERLQVVAAGEQASADDTQLIAASYVIVYNQLAGLGLVSWALTEDIPDEAGEPLVNAICHKSAVEFGWPVGSFANEGAIGLPNSSLAERQLRQMHAREYVPYPAQPEYF
jgi:hypothetical protein